MGKGEDRVRHDPVTQQDLERYAEAEWQLTKMQAPLPARGVPHKTIAPRGDSIHTDEIGLQPGEADARNTPG